MKTFYIVSHTTANYGPFDNITGYTTHIIAAEATLFDAFSHFDPENEAFDSNHSIKRFVESYELNTATNTWEVHTTERPVIYFPNVLPKPVESVDPWATQPF